MRKDVIILTIPLSQVNGKYSGIGIGIPNNISTSVYIGLQQPDDFVMYCYCQYENRDRCWPDFINAWYIANIYAKVLEKCVGTIAGNPLLSRCSSVFKMNKLPYELEESNLVLQMLPNGQKDIDDLLEQLPPMEYITKVLSLAKEEFLLFDSSLLRIFLEKYEQQIPLALLESLDEYNRWRSIDFS